MEYVSVLAGAAFGDHPRCTDPTVAPLARLGKDASTDDGRPLLTAFAPTRAAMGLARGAHRAAAVFRTAVRAASAAAEDPAVLGRHPGRAERRYACVTGAGPLATLAQRLGPLYRCGPVQHRLAGSVDALRTLPEPQRDAAPRATPAVAIAAARGPAGTSGPHVRGGEPGASPPRSRGRGPGTGRPPELSAGRRRSRVPGHVGARTHRRCLLGVAPPPSSGFPVATRGGTYARTADPTPGVRRAGGRRAP